MKGPARAASKISVEVYLTPDQAPFLANPLRISSTATLETMSPENWREVLQSAFMDALRTLSVEMVSGTPIRRRR